MGVLLGNTRIRIASVLALIWLVYLLLDFSLEVLFMPLVAVVATVSFDLMLTYMRKRRFFFPASALVTGFLIGLILAPSEHPLTFILAAALAMLSKQFIGAGEHRHIFNPAAFGILGAALLAGAPVAWWAVSWSPWTIPLIISVSYTLYQLKRLWLPLTFLVVYGVYFLLRGTPVLLFDPTVFLFAFVMLPEPITSMASGLWRYGFGPLVGLLTILIGMMGVFPDIFLPALLGANLIAFFAKRN